MAEARTAYGETPTPNRPAATGGTAGAPGTTGCPPDRGASGEVHRHLSMLFSEVTRDPDVLFEEAAYPIKVDFKANTSAGNTIWVEAKYLGERERLGKRAVEFESARLYTLRKRKEWAQSDRVILITNVELPNEEKGGFRNSGIIPFVLGKNLHETKSALRETLGDLPELRP